ncbi:hypothetical protein BCR39DRAFT_557284 [Naematelia encephala]|uniref:Uncharacterized protein n=1 Tax=Naematelia encephala TaxID=71784 RepID=A0A1Y2BEA4_9TREE|nr:hypothetical protein BCR39DRAFT_557284 [Naematelia encephala]
MSVLTTVTRPFTISTYDPPSTPIALAAANDSDEAGAERRKTPPQQDSEGSGRGIRPPGQSPPTYQIVTEWMRKLDLQDGQSQEGMFGPYDSQRNSQFQPLPLETTVPGSNTRPPHPFAYNATGTVPFRMNDDSGEVRATEYLAEQVAAQQRSGGPESDLLSRGAAVPGQAARATGQAASAAKPLSRDQSPGMGTFGREGSQAQMSTRRTSPVKQGRKAVPEIPLPPRPTESSAGPVRTMGSAALPESATIAPHFHHPHHDFPFDPAEAQRKQSEAMAHAVALAQLEASTSHPPARPDAVKGPRETYQTMTSEPSFGQLHHRDGHPITRETSIEPLPRQAGPEQGDVVDQPFFHIPFGIPLGAQIPRPMLVTRQGTGIGFGLGGMPTGVRMERDTAPRLVPVESPETVGRKTVKSAYVESVEDEQAPPTTPKRTRIASIDMEYPANTESGIQPGNTVKPSSRTNASRRTHATPAANPPSSRLAPSIPLSASVKAPSYVSAYLPPHAARNSPSETSVASGNRSEASTARLAPQIEVASHPGSYAPTTVSNVKKIVNDSSYHDDILCQLLDASRLNLLGKAAKQALLRAARARVIELRDLRAKGELDEDVPALPSLSQPKKEKKEKKAKKASGRSHGHQSDHIRHAEDDAVRPRSEDLAPPATQPPPWAQSLMDRLADFENRLDQIATHDRDYPMADVQAETDVPPSQDLNLDLLHDLMFRSGGLGGMFGMPIFAPQLPSQQQSSPAGIATPRRSAYIHTLSPSDRAAQEGSGDQMQWGSEVEMPAPGESVSPPNPTGPPIINIQAPTESHMTRSQRNVTPSARSVGGDRVPSRASGNNEDDRIMEVPGAMPDPRERDLPPTPSESIRSQIPSSGHPNARTPLAEFVNERPFRPSPPPAMTVPMPQQNDIGPTFSNPTLGDKKIFYPEAQTTYQTAVETQPSSESVVDKIRLREKEAGGTGKLTIWEEIGQRIFSWAVLWTEEQLKHELEEISLGKQVDDLALSIWFMNQYKRLIRRSLTHDPPLACDKMIVPPLIAEAINKAVHSQNFETAVQLLRDLWHSFGFQERPRVVIALSRHRNETHQWSAHRFDLITHKMVSYRVTSSGDPLGDGRPFMWWHALREAWPECHIPDPSEMAHRVETVQTSIEDKYKNSLLAANMARNLLLGYKVDRECNLDQMRENVFEEVKVLYNRKKAGDLTVPSETRDSPSRGSLGVTTARTGMVH